MAEQDFSKVVQQLQLANQKLENLTRIQSEGGTAKGIIASALPEIINEKQIFGQDKQFRKDEGITKVDELQQDTTDAVKGLEKTTTANAQKQSDQSRLTREIQIAQKLSSEDGFSKLDKTGQNTAIRNELIAQSNQEQLTALRKEVERYFSDLEKNTGKNAANDKVRDEELKQIQKQQIKLQLKNPDLDPSQRKALQKKEKELQGTAIGKAVGGLMKPINAVVNPIKEFLGIKGGIPGVSVANLARTFIAIPLLITFLRSDFFQDLIVALKTIGEPLLNGIINSIKFFYNSFVRFKEGIEKLIDGDLGGLVDLFKGGGGIALALATVMLILKPLTTFNFFKGLVTKFVDVFFFIGRKLTNFTNNLTNRKGMNKLNQSIKGFNTAQNNLANNFNQQSDNLNKQNKKNQKNQKTTRRPRGRFGFLKGIAGTALSILPFMGGGDVQADEIANTDVAPVNQNKQKQIELKNKQDAKNIETSTKNNAKNVVKQQSKGFLSKVLGFGAKAARFAGPIGLAVTAVGGVTSGVMAGVEEFNKSGSVGKAINQGLGGVTEFLSFGLINKDTVAGALDSITGASAKVSETAAETVGMVDKAAMEEIKKLEKRIAEAKERIAKSESGQKLRTHGYRKSQVAGREADAERIADLEEQLKKLVSQKHTGGFLARGQMAMVGERGPEFIMSNSPTQIMSTARTQQLGMAAANQTGGGGMNGSTVLVNTGGNTATNVTRTTTFNPSTHLDTNFDRYQKFA